jgi:hypothetical protein
MSWKELEKKALAGLKQDAQSWVRTNVNLREDNDLLGKSREELLAMFPWVTKVKGRKYHSLNDTACITTLIWQGWLRIKSGEMEPILGNLRTFWYRNLEPFYVDKDLLESDMGPPLGARELMAAAAMLELGAAEWVLKNAKEAEPFEFFSLLAKKNKGIAARVGRAARETSLQNAISDCFDAFVLNGVFRFQDEFKFADPRSDFRIIGSKRPRVVFFTEKEGLWWLCEYAAAKNGITVICSHGEPGLLAMEYFYDALKKEKVSSVDVGALTDYDPWGYAIAENFKEKLQASVFFGGSKVKLKALDASQKDLKGLFTDEELEAGKRDLTKYSQYKQSQVDEWFEKTDGIKGKRYGIHIDLAGREKLKAAVDRWVKSVK